MIRVRVRAPSSEKKQQQTTTRHNLYLDFYRSLKLNAFLIEVILVGLSASLVHFSYDMVHEAKESTDVKQLRRPPNAQQVTASLFAQRWIICESTYLSLVA